MKRLLIFLFFISSNSFGQLGEIYKSNGHQKAKGLNFQLRTPKGFEQDEADRPNIVQKWSKDRKDNSKFVQFMILVYTLPDELAGLSSKDLEEYLKYGGGVKDFTNFDGTSNAKYFVVDNFPGYIVEDKKTVQRLGFEATLYGIMTQTFFK